MAAPVATLPAMMSTWSPWRSLTSFTMSSTPCEWPWEVSITSTSTPASTRAAARSRASAPTPMAAPQRSRPASSWVESGYWVRFLMSFTVMSPQRVPSSSTTGSFSMRCSHSRALASSSVVPGGAVTSGGLRITAAMGWSTSSTKRRSRLVSRPTRWPSGSVIGTPEMR